MRLPLPVVPAAAAAIDPIAAPAKGDIGMGPAAAEMLPPVEVMEGGAMITGPESGNKSAAAFQQADSYSSQRAATGPPPPHPPDDGPRAACLPSTKREILQASESAVQEAPSQKKFSDDGSRYALTCHSGRPSPRQNETQSRSI